MHFSKPASNIFAQEQTKEQLDRQTAYSDLIQKVVNIGTHVLDCIRVSTSSKNNIEKKTVILGFFRRIIELLDSVNVQLRAGCVVPSVNNLRALLEALLQLEYFLKDPEQLLLKYKQCTLMEIDGRIASFSKLKENPVVAEQSPDLDDQIQGLQMELDKPFFDDIRSEYARKVFKASGERRKSSPKWYSFSNGPENVWQLAVKLKKELYYTTMYSIGSEITHSSNSLLDASRTQDDLTYMVKIRDARYFHRISRTTYLIGYEALELVGKQLGYDDRFKYLRERDKFRYANRKRILELVNEYSEGSSYSD